MKSADFWAPLRPTESEYPKQVPFIECQVTLMQYSKKAVLSHSDLRVKLAHIVNDGNCLLITSPPEIQKS